MKSIVQLLLLFIAICCSSCRKEDAIKPGAQKEVLYPVLFYSNAQSFIACLNENKELKVYADNEYIGSLYACADASQLLELYNSDSTLLDSLTAGTHEIAISYCTDSLLTSFIAQVTHEGQKIFIDIHEFMDLTPCEDTLIPTTSLEEAYDCQYTWYEMQVDLPANSNDNFVIISSQTDFDALVSGDCKPTIDFSTYDLIIGNYVSNTPARIDYTFSYDCATKGYLLDVNHLLTGTTDVVGITFHRLIPKRAPVEVNVRINYGTEL